MKTSPTRLTWPSCSLSVMTPRALKRHGLNIVLIPLRTAQPKGRQGHPRNRKLPNRHKVPPELVSLTRGIAGTLRHHFTPTERKAWWSAEQLAIMILFDVEQEPPEWDDWIAPLARLVEHGEEKRKRRISTGRAKQKCTG